MQGHMDNKVIGQVFSTYDYDKFKILVGNRRISRANVSAIQKSSTEEQLIIPILVNENYEIVDGQHRFSAWRNLGKPIYFLIVEGYSLDHVKRANQNSINWTIFDFLQMHKDLEKETFIVIYEMMMKHDLKTHAMIKLISKVTQINQLQIKHDIIDGTLKLNSDDVVRINLFLEHYQDFEFYTHFKDQTFINAFLDLYFYNQYEHYQMTSRFDKNKHFLSGKFRDKDDALNTLTRMYSYGVSKNKIFFDQNTRRLYVPILNNN